jgi:hypothetical protein
VGIRVVWDPSTGPPGHVSQLGGTGKKPQVDNRDRRCGAKGCRFASFADASPICRSVYSGSPTQEMVDAYWAGWKAMPLGNG